MQAYTMECRRHRRGQSHNKSVQNEIKNDIKMVQLCVCTLKLIFLISDQ